jgi:hypothetical protein
LILNNSGARAPIRPSYAIRARRRARLTSHKLQKFVRGSGQAKIL